MPPTYAATRPHRPATPSSHHLVRPTRPLRSTAHTNSLPTTVPPAMPTHTRTCHPPSCALPVLMHPAHPHASCPPTHALPPTHVPLPSASHLRPPAGLRKSHRLMGYNLPKTSSPSQHINSYRLLRPLLHTIPCRSCRWCLHVHDRYCRSQNLVYGDYS